jgi:hypothetical protein
VTRSVYVVGGAGTGKSTFMAQMLEGSQLGPLETLCEGTPTVRGNLIKLRGHRLTGDIEGVYLGVMRDSFPGTDGLDRVSGMLGEQWLREAQPEAVVGEGSTLCTERFLSALAASSDLLLVHLTARMEEKLRRFAQRGSDQNPGFVLASSTRAHNSAAKLLGLATIIQVDSEDDAAWDLALDLARAHVAV